MLKKHKDNKVSVTVCIDESVYEELQELADNLGEKSVPDVIPGILLWFLDDRRDVWF